MNTRFLYCFNCWSCKTVQEHMDRDSYAMKCRCARGIWEGTAEIAEQRTPVDCPHLKTSSWQWKLNEIHRNFTAGVLYNRRTGRIIEGGDNED
jgi:hypothetical protein